jgi:hypothetical protein
MVTLASELADFENFAQKPQMLFQKIHSVKFFWSESYSMFSKLMALGVERIYYKEIKEGDNC